MKKVVSFAIRILIIVISLICILFGIIGIRDHLWHLLVFGIITIFITLFWNTFKSSSDKTLVSKKWKMIRNIVAGILITFAVFDAGMLVAEVVAAQSNFSYDENLTVIVLGGDVKGDQPGTSLKARLDTAYVYLKEHPEIKVIVSGKGSGELTEAEVMYKYLVGKGIDSARIFQENQARSTPENFLYSNEIIKTNNLPQTVLIVTNDYHQMRASIYAEKYGITAKHLSTSTTWYLFFPLSEREHYIIVMQEWLGFPVDLVTKYNKT